MLDWFINIYVHTELVDWPHRVNSTTVCKCMAIWCVSTYNILFSTLKRLLTMIQLLYIHSATDSDNTCKHTQIWFLWVARVWYAFFAFFRVSCSLTSCGWFVPYTFHVAQRLAIPCLVIPRVPNPHMVTSCVVIPRMLLHTWLTGD